MNPLAIKGIVGLVILAIVFGAGFQVATWKWSGKVEKAVAAKDAAEKEAREKVALEAQWRQDLKDVRAELATMEEENREKDRLYQEAVNRPPEVVVRYRDVVRTVTETIESEDCNEGVYELFTFLQSLPERPQ